MIAARRARAWGRAGALVAALAVAASSRAAPPSPSPCAAGEYWDEPMAMCMPAARPSDSAAPARAPSNALDYDRMTSPDGCGGSSYFLFGMAMCVSKPRRLGRFSGMAMGNLFVADVVEAGRRGRHDFSAPNWAMFDLGVDLARWNRLELDVMLTAELWTTPDAGYPLLFQIGESNDRGQPFIDAQHPHSSPIMGLMLSDVISFSADKTRLVRLSFAPRGESADGPQAMMHRPTGTVNPDAPLGHHIGQDVGHISSTVIGASLFVDATEIDASAFHGREPEPTRIDLPLGAPDSFGLRLVQHLGNNRRLSAAASFAYVTDPEGDPTIPSEWRISGSFYARHDLPRGWRAHSAVIWGGITRYDHATFLESLTGELLFHDDANALWHRLEVLQRTPDELAVRAPNPTTGVWLGALTLGYTRKIVSLWAFDFSVGASGTLSFVPAPFVSAYGGSALVSGKLFVEARLMKMFAAGPR